MATVIDWDAVKAAKEKRDAESRERSESEDDELRAQTKPGGIDWGAVAAAKAKRDKAQKDRPAPQPIPMAPQPSPVAQDMVSREAMGEQAPEEWGLRNDGTKKGLGWLGPLKTSTGQDTSEYTVGVQLDGVETDIPTLGPWLINKDLELMLTDIIPNKKMPPPHIIQQSVDHAKKQRAQGLSVFADSPGAQEGGEVMGAAPEQQAPEISEAKKRDILELRRKYGSGPEEYREIAETANRLAEEEEMGLLERYRNLKHRVGQEDRKSVV